MNDPDKVRVDLLKVKRKIYLSYPEGSQERENFLLHTKKAELEYLQELISPELTSMIYTEHEARVRGEGLLISLCLIGGIGFSVMLFGYHQLYPRNWFLSLFLVPGGIGITLATHHILHLLNYFKKFKPFKDEHDKINAKIKKIQDEIKGFKK